MKLRESHSRSVGNERASTMSSLGLASRVTSGAQVIAEPGSYKPAFRNELSAAAHQRQATPEHPKRIPSGRSDVTSSGFSDSSARLPISSGAQIVSSQAMTKPLHRPIPAANAESTDATSSQVKDGSGSPGLQGAYLIPMNFAVLTSNGTPGSTSSELVASPADQDKPGIEGSTIVPGAGSTATATMSGFIALSSAGSAPAQKNLDSNPDDGNSFVSTSTAITPLPAGEKLPFNSASALSQPDTAPRSIRSAAYTTASSALAGGAGAYLIGTNTGHVEISNRLASSAVLLSSPGVTITRLAANITSGASVTSSIETFDGSRSLSTTQITDEQSSAQPAQDQTHEGLANASPSAAPLLQITSPTPRFDSLIKGVRELDDSPQAGAGASGVASGQEIAQNADATQSGSTTGGGLGSGASSGDGDASSDERNEIGGSPQPLMTQLANSIGSLHSEFASLLADRQSDLSDRSLSDTVKSGGRTDPSLGTDQSSGPSQDMTALSMTIQTADSSPIHLSLESENGLATRIILQSDDDVTAQNLNKNRHDLVAALTSAGIDTSTIKIDIVAPGSAGSNTQTHDHQSQSGMTFFAQGQGFAGGGQNSNPGYKPQLSIPDVMDRDATTETYASTRNNGPAMGRDGRLNITA